MRGLRDTNKNAGARTPGAQVLRSRDGPMDLSHSTGPEGTEDLVEGEGLAGYEGHELGKSLAGTASAPLVP